VAGTNFLYAGLRDCSKGHHTDLFCIKTINTITVHITKVSLFKLLAQEIFF